MPNELMQKNVQEELLQLLDQSITDEDFIKVSLANYKGELIDLKSIVVKMVELKKGSHLSFNYSYKTKDETKNHEIADGIDLVGNYLNSGFRAATLFTTKADIILEHFPNGKCRLRTSPPTWNKLKSTTHDKVKNHPISTLLKPYLVRLNITDKNGHVLKHAQDKYRQINHYVEILRPLFDSLDANIDLKIADMGSGKGYLTFALYDFLKNSLKRKVFITGVEMRVDLVELCNEIARENKFDNLEFVQGSIQDFAPIDFNSIIALHACDTATDDAIFKGIQQQVELIVVAPCCHKQIRREMESKEYYKQIYPILKHGIFMERQAEMVTDTLRALYLEKAGYKTKVFEFVSDVHTPKNIMITAVKRPHSKINELKIQDEIDALKLAFGIKTHYLETLLQS